LNSQHETEIETLLKFNERLLGIIEVELNNNRKDRESLQPISERSERESDLMGPSNQGLFKSRKLAPKSERGPNTRNSLVERLTFQGGNKPTLFDKDFQKSEINQSFDNDELSEMKLDQRANSVIGLPHAGENKDKEAKEREREREGKEREREREREREKEREKEGKGEEVKREMNREINELRKFKADSAKFYDSKIGEIKNLSNKLGTYKPEEQFNKISQKLTLSPGTADLIKRVMTKTK
jgi:hypothetical protein